MARLDLPHIALYLASGVFGLVLADWVEWLKQTFSWNRFLIRIGRRVDWSDPDNAPPAFEDTKPHPYEPAETLQCCSQCGGGRKHPVHAV